MALTRLLLSAALLLAVGKGDEPEKVNKATEIIVQSKQHRLTVIGLASKKDHVSTFKKMAKGFKSGSKFLYTQEKDIFERYGVKADDLPALVLLRSFNDAGKDLRNRRDTVKYLKSNGEWTQSALRSVVLKEGVPPIIAFPGNGPDEQAVLDLAFQTPTPKMMFMWKSKEDRSLLDTIYANNADESPSKYFRKVTSFAVDWGALPDELKSQVRQMTGVDKISAPMAVMLGTKDILKGKDLDLDSLKTFLNVALKSSGDAEDEPMPMKESKKESKTSKSKESTGKPDATPGGVSLDDLRKRLEDVLEQKKVALDEEDFAKAKSLKAQEVSLKERIAVLGKGSVDSIDDLKKELQGVMSEKKKAQEDEDFMKAKDLKSKEVELKDKIKSLEIGSEGLDSLRSQLQEATAQKKKAQEEEDFMKAKEFKEKEIELKKQIAVLGGRAEL